MSKNSSRLGWLSAGLAVVYLLLYWLAPGLDSWWGINHLRYFSSQTALLLLAAALIIPLLLLAATPERGKRTSLSKLLVYVVAPAALLVVFYLLHVRTHYLGDGILRAREIETGIWDLPTEPLAELINYLVYQVTTKLAGLQAIEALGLVSYVSGVLFYFSALALVRYLFNGARARVFAMLLLFGSGMTLLFCGYAETYMLLPAAITLFLLLSMKAIEPDARGWWPALLFPILALLHFGNLYLAPVLLLVAHYQWRSEKKPAAILGLVSVAVAAALALMVPRISDQTTLGLTGFLIALAPGGDGYWLLATQHLIDIVSELLLTAAPAMLLLPLTLSALFGKQLWREKRVALMLAALPGAFAFMLLLDSKLGYASDWDLFSSVGLVLIICTLVILSIAKTKLKLVTKVLVCAGGLFAFFSFAMVNAGYDRSIQREVDILKLYGTRGGIGFETMGNHFNYIGDTGRAEQMWREALKLIPHRRTYGNLGQLLLTKNRIPEAQFYLRKGIELDSTYAPLYMILGNSYIQEGDNLAAEPYLRHAVELDSTMAPFHFSLARCLYELDSLPAAEKEAAEAVRLEPDDAAFNSALGLILVKQNKFDEAEHYFLVAQRNRPSDSNTYLNLAELYARTGRMSQAKEILRLYLRLNPNGSARNEVSGYLQRLENAGQP